jgi:hypothetical protein
MTDQELLHQLRHSKGWPTLGNAAADRIEALEAERDALAEKLEQAVKALKGAEIYIRADADHIAAQDGEDCPEYRVAMDCLDPIRATLAAIQEGNTDD